MAATVNHDPTADIINRQSLRERASRLASKLLFRKQNNVAELIATEAPTQNAASAETAAVQADDRALNALQDPMNEYRDKAAKSTLPQLPQRNPQPAEKEVNPAGTEPSESQIDTAAPTQVLANEEANDAPHTYDDPANEGELVVQPPEDTEAVQSPTPSGLPTRTPGPASRAFNPISPQPVTEADIKEMLDKPLAEPIDTAPTGKHREDVQVNEAPYTSVETGFAPRHRAPKHEDELGLYVEPERADAYEGKHRAPGRHQAEVEQIPEVPTQPPTPVA
jgi:hypothetical protein